MLTEFSAICQDDAFERRFEPEGRECDR
jgi:hypothetical protein